jgi:uncharacterized cofD-like protein
MNKKVVVLGGGTGMSTLLRGLKRFPVDITAIVSVCDDGRSTGKLREEFNTIAVGDIRKVIISLSETEPLFEKLLNYRFETTSTLNGHAVGNLLLTALAEISGNMSEGIETIGKVLKLKGKVLPLTDDLVTLMAKMTDGSIVEGEHNITQSEKMIDKVFYKKTPKINEKALQAILEADLIILSMGSLYTSVIPNLLSKEMLDTIDKSKAKIMYVCNMMTQPGETDNFKVSDHINILNSYLGKKKISVVLANKGRISKDVLAVYETKEQKDQVQLDRKNIKNMKIIAGNYVTIENNVIRHDVDKVSLDIFSYLL